jgi:prepilin-type N-terminal cleavage/methylation domain-containing protein
MFQKETLMKLNVVRKLIHSFKMMKNQSGFSLLELMVAMGVSSIVTLAMMQINENTIKSVNSVEENVDLRFFMDGELRAFLSKKNNCTLNFARDGFAGNPTDVVSGTNPITNIKVLRDSSQNPLVTPVVAADYKTILDTTAGNNSVAGRSWLIDTVTMGQFVPDYDEDGNPATTADNATIGTCPVTFSFQRRRARGVNGRTKSSTFGSRYKSYTLNLNCKLETNTTYIKDCRLAGASAESIWKLFYSATLLDDAGGAGAPYLNYNESPGGFVTIGPASIFANAISNWNAATAYVPGDIVVDTGDGQVYEAKLASTGAQPNANAGVGEEWILKGNLEEPDAPLEIYSKEGVWQFPVFSEGTAIPLGSMYSFLDGVWGFTESGVAGNACLKIFRYNGVTIEDKAHFCQDDSALPTPLNAKQYNRFFRGIRSQGGGLKADPTYHDLLTGDVEIFTGNLMVGANNSTYKDDVDNDYNGSATSTEAITNSVAIGVQNKVLRPNSAAAGSFNVVKTKRSFLFGVGNFADYNANVKDAADPVNEITKIGKPITGNYLFGKENSSNSMRTMVFGNYNQANRENVYILGSNNTVTGNLGTTAAPTPGASGCFDCGWSNFLIGSTYNKGTTIFDLPGTDNFYLTIANGSSGLQPNTSFNNYMKADAVNIIGHNNLVSNTAPMVNILGYDNRAYSGGTIIGFKAALNTGLMNNHFVINTHAPYAGSGDTYFETNDIDRGETDINKSFVIRAGDGGIRFSVNDRTNIETYRDIFKLMKGGHIEHGDVGTNTISDAGSWHMDPNAVIAGKFNTINNGIYASAIIAGSNNAINPAAAYGPRANNNVIIGGKNSTVNCHEAGAIYGTDNGNLTCAPNTYAEYGRFNSMFSAPLSVMDNVGSFNHMLGTGYSNMVDQHTNVAQPYWGYKYNMIIGGKGNNILRVNSEPTRFFMHNLILGSVYSEINNSLDIVDGTASADAYHFHDILRNTIIGGQQNQILSSKNAVIVGGLYNKIRSSYRSMIVGGEESTINNDFNAQDIPTRQVKNALLIGGDRMYSQAMGGLGIGSHVNLKHDYSNAPYYDTDMMIFADGCGNVGSSPAQMTNCQRGAPYNATHYKRHRFLARFVGGYEFQTDPSTTGAASCVADPVATGNTVLMLCTSSKHKKDKVGDIDDKDFLDKILAMKLDWWRYNNTKYSNMDGELLKFYGPYAEDFFNTFKVGHSDKELAVHNIAGVAMAGGKQVMREAVENERSIASIGRKHKGLLAKIVDLFKKIKALLFDRDSKIAQLKKDIAELEAKNQARREALCELPEFKNDSDC